MYHALRGEVERWIDLSLEIPEIQSLYFGKHTTLRTKSLKWAAAMMRIDGLSWW